MPNTPTSDPDELARRMERHTADLLKTMQEETARVGEIALNEAVRLTSGPQRTGREKSPVSPVLPIGVRSGALRGGWRIEPFTRGQEYGVRLFNVAPHHIFILAPGGTRHMTPRGFFVALRRFTLAEFRRVGLRVSVRAPK